MYYNGASTYVEINLDICIRGCLADADRKKNLHHQTDRHVGLWLYKIIYYRDQLTHHLIIYYTSQIDING